MVQEKLVLTYPDQTVKLQMMDEADVSLDNMVKVALRFESIQSNCQIIDNSCDISRIVNPTPVMKTEKDKHQETSKCGNCGLSHESVCSAKRKVCRKCGKRNHFERVCRDKIINNLASTIKDVVQTDSFDLNDDPNNHLKWSCFFCVNDGQ